jgi:hypothetical protein
MSNVIAFRRPAKSSSQRTVALEEALEVLAENHMTISSTVLLEGIDNLDEAISKAVRMLRAMPNGKARDLAQAELDHIRAQLAAASRLSGDGARRPDLGPAA